MIRADDLLNWCDDTINWHWGLRATTINNEKHPTDGKAKRENVDTAKLDSNELKRMYNVRSLKNSHLDFSEVEHEKGKKESEKKNE